MSSIPGVKLKALSSKDIDDVVNQLGSLFPEEKAMDLQLLVNEMGGCLPLSLKEEQMSISSEEEDCFHPKVLDSVYQALVGETPKDSLKRIFLTKFFKILPKILNLVTE